MVENLPQKPGKEDAGKGAMLRRLEFVGSVTSCLGTPSLFHGLKGFAFSLEVICQNTSLFKFE